MTDEMLLDADSWVTVISAAKRAGVSRQSIYTWMREGSVRSMRVGRGSRVFWPDVVKREAKPSERWAKPI